MYEVKIFNVESNCFVEPDFDLPCYNDRETLIHFFENALLDGDKIDEHLRVNGRFCPAIRMAYSNCYYVGIERKEDEIMDDGKKKYVVGNLTKEEYEVAMEAINEQRNEKAWDDFMSAYEKCREIMGEEEMDANLYEEYGLHRCECGVKEHEDDELDNESDDAAIEGTEYDEIIRWWNNHIIR